MGLFIAGLILSIPLSILANVHTDKVQTWFARRNSSRTATRLGTLNREYEQAKELKEDRGAMQIFLVARILRVTYISSVSAILSGLLFASSSLFESARFDFTFELGIHLMTAILSLLGWLVAIIGGLAVVAQCGSALRVHGRVVGFTKFEAAVEEQRRKLQRA